MNFSINCEHRGVRCTAVCAGSDPPQTVESGEKVLVGLVMGVVFGLALHTIYGSDSRVLKDSVQWFNIVGNGYVQLLQMIVMPLVFASI